MIYEKWIRYLENDDSRKHKISESIKKQNHSKHYTKEVRERHSLALKGRNFKGTPIICIETQQIFDSTTLATKWLRSKGLRGDIFKCLKEKSLIYTAGGYHWARLKD